MALDVDRVSVDGVWHRHLPHRGKVWWWSEPAPDGRWQRGSEVAGFYLADSHDTAWAEWHRQIEELALRPEDQLPRDLWRFEVDVDAIADLRSEKQLERVGLALPTPKRRESPSRQSVSDFMTKGGKDCAPQAPLLPLARSSASSAGRKTSRESSHCPLRRSIGTRRRDRGARELAVQSLDRLA